MGAVVERFVPRQLAGGRVIGRRRAPMADRQTVRNALTIPFIYWLVLPLALLDISVSIYQWVCFPLYGIARVRRDRYFVLDRHRLPYLNAIEKVNCVYCGYATGVLAFVREVASRTEQYWCPIKHARTIAAPHRRYTGFFDYGDSTGYRRGLPRLRRRLRASRRPSARRASRRRRTAAWHEWLRLQRLLWDSVKRPIAISACPCRPARARGVRLPS